jgi:hypothetical protein
MVSPFSSILLRCRIGVNKKIYFSLISQIDTAFFMENSA